MAKYIKIPEYAKKTGVSPQYIRRIIAKGIITKKSLKRQGKRWVVDPVAADRDREQNLDIINRKTNSKKKPSIEDKLEVSEKAGTGKITFNEARRINEQYKAGLRKLNYDQKSGQLISRAERDQQDFNTARTVRDALLNIPDRISAILAAETDESKVSEFLTKEIRQALEVLSK